MKTCLAFALIALLLAVPVVADEEDEREHIGKLFRAANELSSLGKHDLALAVYEEVVAKVPDATGVRYNAGLAAYLGGRYGTALRHWQHLKGLTPDDGQVRAKLVQTWQALDRKDERDREIDELYTLREETEDEELQEQAFYCRDQFLVGGKKVMVFEHFELVGERAVKVWFGVHDEKGTKLYHLSLGSYDATNEIGQLSGELEEGQRLYHLDGYYPDRHATYGFFKGEPTYDEIRAQVIEIVKEERRPQTSSTYAKPEPDDAPADEPEDAPTEGPEPETK